MINVAYLALVRTEAKVLDGLTCVLGTAEQQGVGAGRRPQSKLIERQSFTTSLQNPGTGSRGEAESCNGQLRNLEEAVIVCDGANDDDGLALVCIRRLLVGCGRDNARDRDGWAVDARHEQTAQDCLVEARVGTACDIPTCALAIHIISAETRPAIAKRLTGEETVKLHKKLDVYVVALGSLAVRAPHMVGIEIDTFRLAMSVIHCSIAPLHGISSLRAALNAVWVKRTHCDGLSWWLVLRDVGKT